MHLSSKVAFDFIEGRLAKDSRIFWQEHLEVCNDCREVLRSWRQLGTELKRSHLKSAPDQILHKVIEFFPYRRDESESTLRSVIATLIFDSFCEPAVAGARGASPSARHLLMRAEEFDIHIKVWSEAGHLEIQGQLLPRGGKKFVRIARSHLLRDGARIETAALDEMGEFRFVAVPEGDLSVEIDLPDLTVTGALNAKED